MLARSGQCSLLLTVSLMALGLLLGGCVYGPPAPVAYDGYAPTYYYPPYYGYSPYYYYPGPAYYPPVYGSLGFFFTSGGGHHHH